ncbi:retrovirus-related pol polyprotein from transposon TNT 1-94 [Tanacetum coccineum]
MSRTMLNEQSLPQKFWCNAIDTLTYILNRILIRAILGKTPYEILRDRKPTLGYFRGFGSKATSTNKLSTDRPSVSTDRQSVSTDRPFVSTDRSNTLYISAASTPTCANASESSFVYLGGKIPIDASTLPNTDLPIDPNMPDLEDASDTLLNDEIFNRAYDDDEDVGAVADFNNMDNTIAVSPIPK